MARDAFGPAEPLTGVVNHGLDCRAKNTASGGARKGHTIRSFEHCWTDLAQVDKVPWMRSVAVAAIAAAWTFVGRQ